MANHGSRETPFMGRYLVCPSMSQEHVVTAWSTVDLPDIKLYCLLDNSLFLSFVSCVSNNGLCRFP